MFHAKSLCFPLFLIFAAVPQVALSTPNNKTPADGNIFINGDHNDIIVSVARETKTALAEIKSKLQSLGMKDKKLTRTLQVLNKKLEMKLDLMNKSNAELSFKIQVMSHRLQTILDKQGQLDAMNETIITLSNTVKSLDERIEKKLDLLNKSNAVISEQVQAMSERLTTLESRVSGADYALLFPSKGTSDYVIIRGMPSLTAVTVCLWIKTNDTGNAGTLIDYAVSGSDSELLLIDYRNIVLAVGNRGIGFTFVSANDGKWHHICLTWENTAGSLKLYKDGKVVVSAEGHKIGHVLRGGGALVLGQDQDSVGGSFQAVQSFIGEMTGVNIWDHVINDQEIIRMSKSCLTGVGNVFQWSDFKAHLKGSVNIIKRSC